jgi:hypothetical protein
MQLSLGHSKSSASVDTLSPSKGKVGIGRATVGLLRRKTVGNKLFRTLTEVGMAVCHIGREKGECYGLLYSVKEVPVEVPNRERSGTSTGTHYLIRLEKPALIG